MGEVRLDQVLARLPGGLPVPLACYLVGRAATAIAARPALLTPSAVRIRADGGVRVAPAEDEVAFAHRPPEVIRGGAASARSAVFSLGSLLVECVTGRAPFERATDMETRLAVAEDEVAPLLGRVAQASPALDEIVARALAKEPGDRFASTVELAERLDTFLDDELHEVGASHLGAAVLAAMTGSDPREAMERADDPEYAGAAAPSAPSAPSGPGASGASPGFRPPSSPAALRRARPEPTGEAPPRSATSAASSPASRPLSQPPDGDGEEAAFASAELRLEPPVRPVREPLPGSPAANLDEEVVRLVDPLGASGGLELDDPTRPEPSYRPAPKVTEDEVGLELDESALQRERERPRTVVDDAHDEPGVPWVRRIALVALGLLLAAMAYQFLVRPLLK